MVDKSENGVYNEYRKRQDLKWLCQNKGIKKITLTLVGGGYFFMVIIMNSTKANIKISYSIAHPPPFVDSNSKEWLLCKWSFGWHNRPVFALFSILPLTSDFSDFYIILYLS